MRISLFIIILAFCLYAQEEGIRTQVKLYNKQVLEGVIEKDSWTEEGFYFITDVPKARIWITWDTLDKEFAAKLRAELLGVVEPVPVREELIIKGVRVITKDGRVYDGILDEQTAKQVILKNVKGYIYLDREQIEKISEVTLPWHQVWTSEEVYQRLSTIKPRTAEDYESLARELAKYGIHDKAREAFQIALILKTPAYPEHKLYSKAMKLADFIKPETFRKLITILQERLPQDDYETVLSVIDEIDKELSASVEYEVIKSDIKLIKAEFNLLREISKEQKILSEFHRTIDALTMTKAFDRLISHQVAVDYIEKSLMNDAVKIIRNKFNLGGTDNSILGIWQKRSDTTLYKFSYGSSSWVIERPDLYDVEKWWQGASNDERFNYLKGLCIERYFNVIRVVHKDCHFCGGSGKASEPTHQQEFLDKCHNCLGLKKLRVIIYR